MMEYTFLGIVVAALVVLIAKIWQVCWVIFWWPYAVTRSFRKQGIKAAPHATFYGSNHEISRMRKAASEIILDINCNDISEKVLPHFHNWSAEYGKIFLFWRGLQPSVCIEDIELAKQVLLNKSGFYVKPDFIPALLAFAGTGLGQLNGQSWVRHRAILNPAFTMDKLKVMTKHMAEMTINMIDNWKRKLIISESMRTTIELSEEFQKLTSDIIAHLAFGSSYVEGLEAFKAQKELERHCLTTCTDIFIPGTQYLPTPSNLKMWKLDNKVKSSLRRIISERIQSKKDIGGRGGYGDDILGLMIEALKCSNKKLKFSMDEIIDESKQFFFSGQESTANLLCWAILMLSLHQEWQDKLREEVLRELCGMEIPEAHVLGKLKLVNMVLLETLRLYGAVIEADRKASKDVKLGNVMIPKGVDVTIQFLKIHRNKEYWGEDANEFNPSRFKNGVSQAAKHPNAFIGFGLGSRGCIGQNYAMLEMKLVISLLLQQFSFFLSPNYKHAPANHLTLQPQFGVPIIVKPFLLSK